MDENHQDGVESKLISSDNQLWIPSLSMKDQKRLDRLRKKSFIKSFIKWIGTGFTGKTSWDVIQLLLIPLVLAGTGYGFSYTQMQSNLQSSQRQHDTDLQIAEDQQRETTLKTCLDNIKDLLLNKSLRASKPKDEVRVVARGEVLVALRQLDGEHRGLLMQFLYEAGVITGSRNDVVIDLSGANLSSANLSSADLLGAHLSSADLSGAHLDFANLSFANLSGAHLSDAHLSVADLSDANLLGVRITKEQLKETKSLNGTIMPDGSTHP